MSTGGPDTAAPQASIDRDARRALVRGAAASGSAEVLNGIDIVEVLSNHEGTPGHLPDAPLQSMLLVYLLRGPVPADLTADRVRVLGGVRHDPRINPVRVTWAHPAAAIAGTPSTPPAPVLDGVQTAERDLVAAATNPADRERVLVVRTSSSGDWSTYVLALLGSGGTGYPVGFDEPLCREPFTFTVDCPHPFDCRCSAGCPPNPGTSVLLDYLARDYAALRTRLVDRFAEIVPGWRDANPADPAVSLLELFAYLGDRLTLWQDAVAAEAYLPTARRRASVRRHARMLDYRVHEGCAARTWLTFTVPAGPDLTLAKHHPVGALPPRTRAATVSEAVQVGGTVFETLEPVVLARSRNALALHAWGDVDACLPVGSTAAFLSHPSTDHPELAAGDVLVLAPVDEDGVTVSGDEVRRHAVRLVAEPVVRHDPLAPGRTVLEVSWAPADALAVPLPISRRGSDGSAAVAAVALANVVLAEHAGSLPAVPLEPAQVPDSGPYSPRLPVVGTVWVDEQVDRSSAAASLVVDPRRGRAQVQLDDGARTWTSVPDLLASGRLDAHVVAEPDQSRQVRLRFGDGVSGRRPAAGAVLDAHVRVGGGTAGNVGPDVLTTVLATPAAPAPAGLVVSNPLAAVGGTEPEPMEAVRELAPYAFRSQLRAVTAADYAAAATEMPGVQRAVARRRWAGSWYAHEVTLDLAAEHDLGSAAAAVSDRLEVRRLAGVDVELAPPVAVPLDIVVSVCVSEGYLRADVHSALLLRMSAGVLADGTRGFFHPDQFTFGQPLYVSDLVGAVMAVPGVSWVDVGDDGPSGPLRFRRLGREPAGEVAAGRIPVASREVLRADSDPSTPENGQFDVVLRGGS